MVPDMDTASMQTNYTSGKLDKDTHVKIWVIRGVAVHDCEVLKKSGISSWYLFIPELKPTSETFTSQTDSSLAISEFHFTELWIMTEGPVHVILANPGTFFSPSSIRSPCLVVRVQIETTNF